MSKSLKTKIVSLRIDPQLGAELAFIAKRLKSDLSTAIKESIHAKYNELKANTYNKTSGQILMESGFVASFEGNKNLSGEYKGIIAALLKKKHV